MAARPRTLVASVDVCILILATLLGVPAPVAGGKYTPETPEVRAMIEKALGFLDKGSIPEDRLGGICLVGMAFHKAGHEASHVRIRSAVQACQIACKKTTPVELGDDAIYSIGIAAVFLADLNPTLHRREIDTLSKWLSDAQKPHGGWGYYVRHETGDTSMTQYAVLSLWTMQHAGVPSDTESIRKVARWLARTQDPSGFWGYQGSDPGNYNRVTQTPERYSMLAAGLGSVYICADMLGVSGDLVLAARDGVHSMPDAFVPVVEAGDTKRVAASPELASLLGRATNDGDTWFDENYRIDVQEPYPIYYLYALERYLSFRELTNPDSQPKNADWYDDGVEYLAARQNEDGAWVDSCGAVPSTALGTLFLMRSTKKSIDKANYGQGVLAGGRGLPIDMANAQVRRGKVVGAPVGGKVDDVLAILDDPLDPKFEALIDNPGAIEFSSDSVSQASQIERFRRILRSNNNPLARRLAVKALSQHRDLDNVPFFIYALSDGDQQVAIGARDGLRFVSRKFDGFGMPDNPTKEDKMAATLNWKKWYRTIRPDAEFLE